MERIRPLTKDDAHADAQGAYDQAMRRFGQILNTTGVRVATLVGCPF